MQRIFNALLLTLCAIQISPVGAEEFLAVLTLDDAARKIIQQNNYKVLATKTESGRGKSVHIIKVLTPDGRIQYIKIDAKSGEIVK